MPLEKILLAKKHFFRVAVLSLILPLTAYSQRNSHPDETDSLGPIIKQAKSLLRGAQKVPIYLLDTATSMGAALRAKATGEDFDLEPIFSDYLPSEYKSYLGYTTTLHDETPNVWQYIEDKDVQNLGTTLAKDLLPEKSEQPDKPAPQNWPAGIWIRETPFREILSPKELEERGLCRAGYCIDANGNFYQVYRIERYPAFVEPKGKDTVAIYHTDTKSGIKITEANNALLDKLGKIDPNTTEQTTTDTKTGKITVRERYIKK